MMPEVRSATKICWVTGSKARPPRAATPWAAASIWAKSTTSPVAPSTRQTEPGLPPNSGGPNWPGTNCAPTVPVRIRRMVSVPSGR